MNLEAVEQTCLSYLKQTERPLVPLDNLLTHLHRNPECADVGKGELLAFLRRHELFEVVEPVGLAADPEGEKAMAEAGLPVGPQVVLCTRVPSSREFAQMMHDQMMALIEALSRAVDEAQAEGQIEQVQKAGKLLDRAKMLRDRMAAHLKP